MQSGFSWGKSSSAPASVSVASKNAQTKAAQAKKAADSAVSHAEKAQKDLGSYRAEYEVNKAKSDAAKADAAAKAAAEQAYNAELAAKNGTFEAISLYLKAQKAAEEAKQAADEANRLAKETDDAYREYNSKKSAYEDALADANAKSEEYDAAEAYRLAAEKADKEYRQAWKDYENACAEMNKSIDLMIEKREDKTSTEYTSLVNDFYKKEAIAKAKYEIAEQKAEPAISAYKKLGEYYNNNRTTGDPVLLANGDFVAEYVDYTAQDYLDKFIVKRNLLANGYEESFGTNWTCSLDSRIIRCNFNDWSNIKQLVENCIDNTRKMKQYFVDYNNNNPGFPREETQGYVSYAESMNSTMNNELVEVNKIIELRNYLSEKNKYCTYGRYKNPDNYFGYSKQLIFLDEDGNEQFYKYENNGKWISFGIINRYNAEIYNINADGNRSNNDNSDGGYEIVYDNGNTSLYNKYGILIQKKDKNGNITSFSNSNGRINEITLKTGEHLYIERNTAGYITKIKGEVSGVAEYQYRGDELTRVISNNKNRVNYSYFEKRLCEITKAKNQKVSIKYEYDGFKNKYVCSQITNANGDTEYFEYNYADNLVTHVTYEGKREIYRLNEFGNPIYIKDDNNDETTFQCDSNSIITGMKKAGSSKSFLYDSCYRLVKVDYASGGSTSIEYLAGSSGDFVTRITDADGFSKRYFYDSKNNITAEYLNDTLISTFEYFSNGLVKKKSSDGDITEFEYNSCGSITKMVITRKSGKRLTTYFEYNASNQLIKSWDDNNVFTKFEYASDKTIETTSKYIKTTFFNECNLPGKIEYKDLVSGKSYVKEFVYDGSGKIVQELINGELFHEYEYSKDNVLNSRTKWGFCDKDKVLAVQGIKEKYLYNASGFLVGKTNSAVNNGSDGIETLSPDTFGSKLEYEDISGHKVVSVVNEMGIKSTNTYDSLGRLIREDFSKDYYRKTVYTKAGRISYKTDSDFTMWEYKYKADGSWTIYVKSQTGTMGVADYDRYGRIISFDNTIDGKKVFAYENNKLIEEKASDYTVMCDYDIYGRQTAYSFVEKNQILKQYKLEYKDDLSEVLAYEKTPQEYFSLYKIDSSGNAIVIDDKKGITRFEYDALCRVLTKTDGSGSVTSYSYDANSLPCYVVYPDNTKRIIKHSVLGTITEINENGKQLRKTEFDIEKRKVTYSDCFGNPTEYNYDLTGLITNISYKRSGELNSFLNNTSGEEQYNSTEVIRNAMGNVVKLQNSTTTATFSYDNFGNIKSTYDTTAGLLAEYDYDRYGRCIKQNLNGNVTCFEYNNCGLVSKVETNNNSVFLDYDTYGRIVQKKFWNGIVEKITYNDFGLLESKVITDKLNQIVYGQFILYDSNGRITYKFNNKCEYEHFTYNEKGQLITAEYPFSSAVAEYYMDEAIDCGCPFNVDVKATVLYVESEYLSSLYAILNRCGLENRISIPSYQESWKEDFSYNTLGAVSSVRNNIGTILYEYDKCKLTGKSFSGYPEKKMTVTWNEQGCMAEVQGVLSDVKLAYGNNKRIEKIDYINKKDNSSVSVKYSYDSLNRRVRESYDNGLDFAILYDGFSSKQLSKTAIYKNNLYSGNDSAYLQDANSGIYRYMQDDDYIPFGESKNGVGDSKQDSILLPEDNIQNTLVRGETLMQMVSGKETVVIKDSENKKKLQYDDMTFDVSNYDVYGSEYTVKYNLFSNIINAGYRDFISSLKTFTSEDPVRDGANWYSYCAGDPVNYFDNDGRVIIPVAQTYLMTDEVYSGIAVGNSSDAEEDGINKVGCYITCYANAVCELYGMGVLDADKIQYTSVFGVNDNKDLYLKNEKYGANIKRDESMNEVFKSSNDYADVTWDYFTEDVSGNPTVRVELAKAYASKEDYVVMGVFDLSDTYTNVPNHMVILNGASNDNGVFENITASSKNDLVRQRDNPDVYCESNLKEIRLVKVESKCS